MDINWGKAILAGLIGTVVMTIVGLWVALGVPVGTVRSRLFRARRLLQEALINHARDTGLVRWHADTGISGRKS